MVGLFNTAHTVPTVLFPCRGCANLGMITASFGGHGLASAFDPHDRYSSSVLEPALFKQDARRNLTRSISNTRSTEPVGLSAQLAAGSER